MKKLDLTVSGVAAGTGAVALVLVSGLLAVHFWQQHTDRLLLEQAKQQRSSDDAARRALQAEFMRNKNIILADIQAKLDAGKALAAIETAARYPVPDPDLANLKRSAEAAILESELASEAKLPLAERARLYAKLSQANPSNKAYAARARELASSEAVAEQDAKFAVPPDESLTACYPGGGVAAHRFLMEHLSAAWTQEEVNGASDVACSTPNATNAADPSCYARCLTGFRNRLTQEGWTSRRVAELPQP